MILPEFLTRDRYGEIRLRGHRIGLYHVVFWRNEGHSPEQIVEQFPTLPLELVHEVLAFYGANRADVDAYVRSCQDELDRQRAAGHKAPSLSELRGRKQALTEGPRR